jgi:hypothetical protein
MTHGFPTKEKTIKRKSEQTVQVGLANPLRFFASLLTDALCVKRRNRYDNRMPKLRIKS